MRPKVAAAATLDPEMAPKMALATIMAEPRLPGDVAEHLLRAQKQAPHDPGRGVDGPHEHEERDRREGEGIHHIERGPGKIVQGLIHEEEHPEAGHDPHRRRDLDSRGHQEGQPSQEGQGLEFEGHVLTPPRSSPPAA